MSTSYKERQPLLASHSEGTLYSIDDNNNGTIDSNYHASTSSDHNNEEYYNDVDTKNEDHLTTQPWKYKAVALACALFLAGIVQWPADGCALCSPSRFSSSHDGGVPF